jgi:hypothetical protein
MALMQRVAMIRLEQAANGIFRIGYCNQEVQTRFGQTCVAADLVLASDDRKAGRPLDR